MCLLLEMDIPQRYVSPLAGSLKNRVLSGILGRFGAEVQTLPIQFCYSSETEVRRLRQVFVA